MHHPPEGLVHRIQYDLVGLRQFGRPLLMFPTSAGRFFENEDMGLVGSLADKVDRGELQRVSGGKLLVERMIAEPVGQVADLPAREVDLGDVSVVALDEARILRPRPDGQAGQKANGHADVALLYRRPDDRGGSSPIPGLGEEIS